MDELGEMLGRFGMENMDRLLSKDSKRKIISEEATLKIGLSSIKKRELEQITALKNQLMLHLFHHGDFSPFLKQRCQHIIKWISSLLASAPSALAQKVHYDYELRDFGNHPRTELPWSFLMPLQDYCLLGIREVLGPQCERERWLIVKRGQCLFFRGDLLHCGGPNRSSANQYRIDAYGVTEHFSHPENEVLVSDRHTLEIELPAEAECI
jgi:hypothetical protein